MEPLPIGQMNIEVYNIEESPLHQIVKKLIYKPLEVIWLKVYMVSMPVPHSTRCMVLSVSVNLKNMITK